MRIDELAQGTRQMPGRTHHYAVQTEWTGNRGDGTTSYRAYERAHTIRADGKPELLASADPAFRGDRSRYNPEELLVAALSGCHMLTYLHLCAVNHIVVTAYRDAATGSMQESADGGGDMTEVVLRPHVAITSDSDADMARRLHERAHQLCFIARSVRFPVRCEPEVVRAEQSAL